MRRPWATEEERIRINNEFAAMYGFAGYDGCGGIFSKTGMSSNPYFVQDKTGLTREQLNAAGLASVSDAVLGSDLWRQGFLQMNWNGFSTVGSGMQWPPNLIRQPRAEGVSVFLGVNNGSVNWNMLLSAQPRQGYGTPVAPVVMDVVASDTVDGTADSTAGEGNTWTSYVV